MLGNTTNWLERRESMDSEPKLYFLRAENEFLMANIDLRVSTDAKVKEILGIQKEKTFFSSVITHAYYSIFYSAKAYLISKEIKTEPPEEHKKTYIEFSKLVNKGVISKELFRLYEDEALKAEALLRIFRIEKKKRGFFTYNIKSESNLPYAKESVENAKRFTSTIKAMLGF